MNTTTTVSNSSQYYKLEEIIISYMETHVFWSLCLKTSLSGVRARNRPKGITTIKSFTSEEGVHGLFQNELLVHGKFGTKCPNCCTII